MRKASRDKRKLSREAKRWYSELAKSSTSIEDQFSIPKILNEKYDPSIEFRSFIFTGYDGKRTAISLAEITKPQIRFVNPTPPPKPGERIITEHPYGFGVAETISTEELRKRYGFVVELPEKPKEEDINDFGRFGPDKSVTVTLGALDMFTGHGFSEKWDRLIKEACKIGLPPSTDRL